MAIVVPARKLLRILIKFRVMLATFLDRLSRYGRLSYLCLQLFKYLRYLHHRSVTRLPHRGPCVAVRPSVGTLVARPEAKKTSGAAVLRERLFFGGRHT